MKKNLTFKNVISFRVTPDEKKELDKLIQGMNTNKSDFLREKIRQVLLTIKD